jgi:hypothetical protein
MEFKPELKEEVKEEVKKVEPPEMEKKSIFWRRNVKEVKK